MDIRDIIQKLNSINAQDLKNIDIHALKDTLLKKPDILINIFIVIVTFGLVIHFYGKNRQSSDLLRQEIPSLEEKLSLVEENKKVQGTFDEFISDLPPQVNETSQLMAKISEIAVINAVQISSVSSPVEINDDYSHLISIQTEISAEEYEQIVNFIKDIEQAQLSLRVSQWKGTLKNEQFASSSYEPQSGAGKRSIQATVEIEAVQIKK